MSIRSIDRFTLRRVAAAVAVAALPLTAFAWGSQAGDNGQQPIGADNDGPRQAIPNETRNDVSIETQIQHRAEGRVGSVYAGSVHYAAPTEVAPYDCDREPLAQRAECRDAAAGRYDVPGTAYVESYPGYMTYYYPYPGGPVYWRYDTYAATPDYYVYSPDGAYSASSTVNPTTRCRALYGANRGECLRGSLPGG